MPSKQASHYIQPAYACVSQSKWGKYHHSLLVLQSITQEGNMASLLEQTPRCFPNGENTIILFLCSEASRKKGIWRLSWSRHHIVFRILELSIKSPSLSPPISSAFAPYPLFQWYPQSMENLLNLGMKWLNSAFNAQGFRVIIEVVHVGAMKIYVAAVQALRIQYQTRERVSPHDTLGPSKPLGEPIKGINVIWNSEGG